MLNPTFTKAQNVAVRSRFVVSGGIASRNLQANESFDTGSEYRLQPVYGDEIWLKLRRAGLTPSMLAQRSVLEVCAGTGFLTYHLLSRCSPRSLTVNDISAAELESARHVVEAMGHKTEIEWVVGDVHTIPFPRKFDLVIGNSFVHHFHNVPQVLSRFQSLLNPGGVFISLHEPTPMAPVVEGAKILAYPLAVMAPGFVNDVIRARHHGEPSDTDLWLFEPKCLGRTAREAGFAKAEFYPWHLLRPIMVQRHGLHLSARKPHLDEREDGIFRRAVKADACLNRFLPHRFFGSICLVCHK